MTVPANYGTEYSTSALGREPDRAIHVIES